MVKHAAKSTEQRMGLSRVILEVVFAIAVFIALATPLALWIAWSQLLFYWVLGIGGVAMVVAVILSRLVFR